MGTRLERISSKRILYFLCFVAVHLIEFTKATQTGDVWYVTVNLTGLAVFGMIASTFSHKELWNWRNFWITVLSLAAMGIIAGYHASSAVYFHLGQVESAVVNVWWLLITVGIWRKRFRATQKKKCRWNKRGILWSLLMLLLFLSVNERLWPLWFWAMFGAFYLTDFTDRDRTMLLDSLLDAGIFCFFVFQIYAYATRPYDTIRYVGFYENANTVALYYLIVYGMILCKLHICHCKKAHWGWKLFYFLGAGGLLCFQLFTLCRTAWIISAVLTSLYGCVIIHRVWQKTWRRVVLYGAALFLMICLTFLPVYGTIRFLPTLTHYRVWYVGEYLPDKVHSFDPPDSWKYIELEEFLDAFLGRMIHTIKGVATADPFLLQVHAQEREHVDLIEVPWTEDESIRTRLTIYKTYLRDLTWYGNPIERGFYQIGEKDLCFHAQNLWIQIAYSFGIPAGILFCILTVVIIVCQCQQFGHQREDPYAWIPITVCVIFFLFGLTEVVWLPGQLILFLFFWVQHPRLVYSNEKQEKEGDIWQNRIRKSDSGKKE